MVKIELEVFSSGQKVWRKNGSYHREDGYSIDYGSNSKTYGFFRDGKLIRIESPSGVKNFTELYKEDKNG